MKYNWKGDYHEGLARVKKGKKFGFIDENEKLVIPAKFINSKDFSEGLAAVQIQDWEDVSQWGYIDKKGVMVIAPKYLYAGQFSNGLAECNLWKFMRIKGKMEIIDEQVSEFKHLSYIDKTGKIIYMGKNIPDNVESEIHQLPLIKTEEDAIEAARTGAEASLYYVPDELKTEKVCMEAVKNNGDCFRFVPKKLKTAELCMEAVKNSNDGFVFEQLPDEYKNQETLLEAVKRAYPLKRALLFNGTSPEFKSIPMTGKIYYEAVKADCYNMELVPNRYWTYEIFLEAVKQNGNYLFRMPKEYFNPEICLEAVKPNTSWRQLNEPTEYGRALEFVPEEFITEELCLLSVRQNGWNLHHVPLKYRTKELCEIALNHQYCGYNDIPKEFLTEEWCYIAIKAGSKHNNFGPDGLSIIPEGFRSERICLEAAKYDVRAIENIPWEYKTKELCLIAIKTMRAVVNDLKDQIPADYWNDVDFCKEAVKQNFHALKCVPDKIRKSVNSDLLPQG